MTATRSARTIALLFTTVLIFLTSGVGAAQAEEPLNIDGPVTDAADVLGADRPKVEDALDDFFDETGLQLFVVYVDTFGGQTGFEWAHDTATKSGIGVTDILLAVATDERSYGISVDDGQAISDADLEKVERNDILPELRDGDWAGAAIAAARGYTDAAKKSSPPWGAIVVGGVVLLGGGAYLVHRSRRRYRLRHPELDEHGQPADPYAKLGTEDVLKEAGAALVHTDDALRTSEQELGFAVAQFGTDVTAEFRGTVDAGKEHLKEAFALRQRLDDDEPDTDPEARAFALQILAICDRVNAELDAQVDAFDAMRDLQARAPEVLAATGQRAADTRERVPAARAQLEQLATAYPATSLASLRHNPDQAEALLTLALDQVEKGDAFVAGDDRAAAVVSARAAEDAVAQASLLLDAIAGADDDLQQAARRTSASLSSIGLDIADAARLAPADPGVSAAAAAANQAVAYAQTPDHDPLAAVKGLVDAEAALDELLAPLRAAAEEAEKARTALNDSLGRVASLVKGVSDFIETRRGAVGSQARTRLSEAARHLDHAQRVLDSDPTTALQALQKSEQYAQEAQRLAQKDADDFDRRQRRSTTGGGVNSAVLGGILIDSLVRGGFGVGLGGSGGRSSGGNLGPGSFGGGGTRGRRGGGGRF